MTDIPMPMFGDPVGPWQRWFAWMPVRTYDQRFVWLRRVWRRGIYKHQYLTGGSDFWFQYSLDKPAPVLPYAPAFDFDPQANHANAERYDGIN